MGQMLLLNCVHLSKMIIFVYNNDSLHNQISLTWVIFEV